MDYLILLSDEILLIIFQEVINPVLGMFIVLKDYIFYQIFYTIHSILLTNKRFYILMKSCLQQIDVGSIFSQVTIEPEHVHNKQIKILQTLAEGGLMSIGIFPNGYLHGLTTFTHTNSTTHYYFEYGILISITININYFRRCRVHKKIIFHPLEIYKYDEDQHLSFEMNNEECIQYAKGEFYAKFEASSSVYKIHEICELNEYRHLLQYTGYTKNKSS